MANYRSDYPEQFGTEDCVSNINSVLCQILSWYEESSNPTEDYPKVLTLEGPPGVGKTSLCTQFINHVSKKYPTLQVVWAEGRTIESLVSFLEQQNSHSCEAERCSSELLDHQAKLFVEKFNTCEQKAILVILPSQESQASHFVTKLVHSITQFTQLKNLCIINLALSKRKRTESDSECRDATASSTVKDMEGLSAAVQSHLKELVKCTSVSTEMCHQLLQNGTIAVNELDELINTSTSNDFRANNFYSKIVPKLDAVLSLEMKFKEALCTGGNLRASMILAEIDDLRRRIDDLKIDEGLCIELKKPKPADAERLIRQINSSISSADIAHLCDLTNFNPLLLKVSASLITLESALFGNSAAKFIRGVQKLKNNDRGSRSCYNIETGETQTFPFIKYACDYLASNYHLGSYALKLLKLSPNLKTWLPVHEFQNLKFPAEMSGRRTSPNLVSLKWLANLGFIHLKENEELFRVSNTVKDYFSEYILREESRKFVLETILLNILKTRNFTGSVINPFGKILEAFSLSLNIFGNQAMAILRQPTLRQEIADSKGISIKQLLQTVQQKLETQLTNLEIILELDSISAENKYFEGKITEAFKIFREACVTAHLKLGATNLTFLRIAETYCFYLGIEDLENEAQFLFNRLLVFEDGHGKLGIIDEEAMAARKVFYSSWKQSRNSENTEDVTENPEVSIEVLPSAEGPFQSHMQQVREETVEIRSEPIPESFQEDTIEILSEPIPESFQEETIELLREPLPKPLQKETIEILSEPVPESFQKETVEILNEPMPEPKSAVQIVNMKTQPNGSSQFILQESVLRKILSEVGDRHIYLISIAGATRQGKSFLMNVIRHYFDELERGTDSPWESISQLEKLEGFHIENKNIRDTIGFWMWPRPFVFKQRNGEEIAVLLMDTQGVFDKFTSRKEWSMIVGLSLLTSSCVIYNLLNNLLEDNLEILTSFVEFGILAAEKNRGKENTTKHAFHKLLFLIRDWGFPNHTPYGPKGGNTFIENHFKIHPKLSEQAQLLRKTLRTVFKELDCFLMPHPGKAAKENTFEGSLRKLNPEFKENLKIFLSILCKTDELQPLTIANREVKGTDLYSYFSKFTELLNKQEIPNSTSIYDASREAELLGIIREYADSAKREIEKLISKEGFLTDLKLKEKYESISKRLLDRFNQIIKGESPQSLTDYFKLLTRSLKIQLQVKNEEGKRRRIEQLTTITKEKYTKKVEDLLKNATHSSVEIANILAEAKASVLQSSEFESTDEEFLSEIQLELDSMIQARNLYHKGKYLDRRKAESDYKIHLQKLLEEYDKNMNMMFSDEDLITADSEKILKLHSICEERMLKELCVRIDFKKPDIKYAATTELKAMTSQRLESRLLKLRNIQDAAMSNAMMLVQQAAENYSKQMIENIAEYPSETELANFHHMLKLEASQVMFQVYCIVGSNEASRIRIKETLDTRIAKLYESIRLQENLRRNNLSEKWESVVNEAVHSHEKKVKAYIESQPYPTEDELKRFIESTQETIINKAEISEWLKEDHLKSKLKTQVKERLGLLEKSLVQHYNSVIHDSVQLCFEDAKLWGNNYRKLLASEYDQMKTSNSMSVENLKYNHTTLADKFVEQFKEKWRTIMPYSLFTNVIPDLQSHMNGIFMNFSKQMDTFVGEKTAEIEQLVTECFEVYAHEMEWKFQEICDTSRLERLHNLNKNKAKKTFSEATKDFSSLPEVGKAKLNLKLKINKNYSHQLQNLKQAQKNLDNQIEEIVEESLNIYRKEFSLRSNKIQNENELNSLHLEVLKISMTNLEVKISVHNSHEEISVQRLLTEKLKLERLLVEEFQKQCKQWKSKQSELEENIENIVENILIDYTQDIKESLGKFDFIDESVLEATHNKLSKSSTQKFRDTIKPLSADISAHQTRLETELKIKFQTIKRENTSSREKILGKIQESFESFKHKYQVSQINNTTMWDSNTAACKEEVNRVFNQYNIPHEVKKQLIDKFTREMNSANTATKGDDKRRLKTQTISEPMLKNNLSSKVHDVARSSSKAEEYLPPTLNEAILPENAGAFAGPSSASPACQGASSTSNEASGACSQSSSTSQASGSSKQANYVKPPVKTNIVIGIDFGNTYCYTAYCYDNEVKIIPHKNGDNWIASTVRFVSADETIVGEKKDQLTLDPTQSQSTIFDTKRLIGRKFDDEEVQENMKLWPFKVINHNNIPKIEIHNQSFFAEEVHSLIIKYLKENAEIQLGCEVKQAVITVPVSFTDEQRRATKNSARNAGLEVLEILNEPTAAAIAYNLHLKDVESRNIFVFDFGGGTLDVSILSRRNGNLEVIASDGNNHLGGRDIDAILVDYCVTEFKRINNMIDVDFDVRDSTVISTRIRHHCEAMKRSLSNAESYQIVVPNLYNDKNLDITLTRSKFENLIEPILQEAINLCKALLVNSSLTVKDISDVILVGGSCRISRLQELLKVFFEREDLRMTLNPEEVVVRGAAYRAAMIKETECNTKLPYAIWVDLDGDKLSLVIPKKTLLPLTAKLNYYFTSDSESEMNVRIFEGDNLKADESKVIAKIPLRDICSVADGEEQVELTLEIDMEGFLSAFAFYKSSGTKIDIEINSKLAN